MYARTMADTLLRIFGGMIVGFWAILFVALAVFG